MTRRLTLCLSVPMLVCGLSLSCVKRPPATLDVKAVPTASTTATPLFIRTAVPDAVLADAGAGSAAPSHADAGACSTMQDRVADPHAKRP